MIPREELTAAIRKAANDAVENVDEFCSENMACAAALTVQDLIRRHGLITKPKTVD